jgi:hypothetical protein
MDPYGEKGNVATNFWKKPMIILVLYH